MKIFFVSWIREVGIFRAEWRVEKRIVVTDGDEQSVREMFANEQMNDEPTIFEITKPTVFVIPEKD